MLCSFCSYNLTRIKVKHLICPCAKERYCDLQCQKRHWNISHSSVCEYKKNFKNTESSQNNSRESVPSHSRDNPDCSAPSRDKPGKSVPSFQKSDKSGLKKSDGKKLSGANAAFVKPSSSHKLNPTKKVTPGSELVQSPPILESVVSAANPDLIRLRNKNGQFKSTEVIN